MSPQCTEEAPTASNLGEPGRKPVVTSDNVGKPGEAQRDSKKKKQCASVCKRKTFGQGSRIVGPGSAETVATVSRGCFVDQRAQGANSVLRDREALEEFKDLKKRLNIEFAALDQRLTEISQQISRS